MDTLDHRKISRITYDLLSKHGRTGAKLRLRNWLNRCIQQNNESCIRHCEECLRLVEMTVERNGRVELLIDLTEQSVSGE